MLQSLFVPNEAVNGGVVGGSGDYSQAFHRSSSSSRRSRALPSAAAAAPLPASADESGQFFSAVTSFGGAIEKGKRTGEKFFRVRAIAPFDLVGAYFRVPKSCAHRLQKNAQKRK